MVNENKWGLLYCPRGGWRSNKRWEKIEKVLKQQSVDYDFVQSENQKSVERLIRMFINNGYKTIVIVGGDSALNDAVNCLMQIDPKEREEVALTDERLCPLLGIQRQRYREDGGVAEKTSYQKD